MNNKKCIVNLEYFREMLQISPRIPNQQFDELPFEEEILAFLRELGHSGEINMITDVNINKLYKPWRSFAVVINKCLSGKSTEHKDAKKSNKIYYPRFIKVIVNFFMTKDQSILRRNKRYGVILPIELTNEEIINSESYKEYYAIASGVEPPKTKASVMKKQSSSDTTIPSPTKGKRLKTSVKVDKPTKEKQPAKSSTTKGLNVLFEVALTEAEQIKLATKRSLTRTHISYASGSGAYKGTGIIPGVLDVPNYEFNDKEIAWKSSDEDDDNDDDEEKISKHDDDDDDQSDDDDQEDQDDDDQDDHDDDNDQDEQDDDDDQDDQDKVRTPSHDDKTNDEDKDEDSDGMNVKGDKGANEEDDADELYRNMNINLEGQQQSSSMSSHFVSNMLNPSPDTCIGFIFDSTPRVDVLVSTGAEPPRLSATTLPLPTISIIPHVQQTPTPSPANVSSSSLQNLPNFGSLFGFDHRLKTLETNFSEFMQTNQFAEAVSSIPDRLRDKSQAENEDFLNKLDENIQKIIKEQVKVQVSKILQKIKKTINEQLEAEVLTRSSNSSKTSYAVAADLSELELNKILIEKMESNKSIHISDEQKNLYKALRLRMVQEKTRRRRTRVNQCTKGKYIQDIWQEFETGATDDQPVEEASQHPYWFQKQAKPPTPDSVWNKTLPATNGRIQPWISNLAKKTDSHSLFNELMDTLVDFSAFVMNRLKVDTLTPGLLAGPTYELMKGTCKSLVELEFFLEEVYKATTDQLDWNNPEGQQYPHDLLKPLPLIPNSRGAKESAQDVYSKRRIIAITELQIVEWHNYKHLDWITVRKDDDKLYKFKEGVESYQKKLNLTKPDTYRSDLKRKEAYTAYSNPRAKDNEDYAEFGEVCWWQIVRGRLSATSKDHMIYHMMSSSNKDCDGIPKRLTMYLNLWSYKVVRNRSKSKNTGIVPTEMELILEQTQQGISHEVSNTLAEYMILSEADNRPPMLDKDLVTRTKTYAELSAADCDMNERECKLYDAFDKFTHIKGEALHKYCLRFTQLISDLNIYNMKMKQFQVYTKFLNSLSPEWSKFVTDVKLVKELHTTNFDQLHAYLEQYKLHANEVRFMRERNQDPFALVANHQMTPLHFNTY
uniref:Integrase, catalytic region, zinc finger, CCHC-type, peptidase aspartic, catalytic n=1 Tax=Tanacetum cinerariifolium TaxID=118510 RepID=A0A699GI65_TANCI|nr:hypothetical protein [Tanacetum cinerariifolium]